MGLTSASISGALMYEKTAKSSHYLPRKGSYSTVPHRNGRVDVLPPEARAPLWDIATQIEVANERIETLRVQRDAAKVELHSLDRFDQLRGKVGSNGSERSRIHKLQQTVERLETEMRVSRRRVNDSHACVRLQASASSAWVRPASFLEATSTLIKALWPFVRTIDGKERSLVERQCSRTLYQNRFPVAVLGNQVS